MECHHSDVQFAAHAVEKFCGRWGRMKDEKPKRLIIQGVSGCGKTHIARHVIRWATLLAVTVWAESGQMMDELPTARFVEWGKVCTPDRFSEKDFVTFLDDISKDSIVAIDDIGSEVDRFKTGANIERLAMVLNERQGKYTLLTTNHLPETWSKVWDIRVADRLQRDSLVIEMKCPSFTTVI